LFWDISYGGDEEVEEINMSQNYVTTKIFSKKDYDDTPNNANPTSPLRPLTNNHLIQPTLLPIPPRPHIPKLK
jgi:hypothetical protein